MTWTRIRFGPGQVWTGTGRRTCDGVVVELAEDAKGQAVKARVVELHDINIAERHVEREVAWYLKRCARQIDEEGLTLLTKEGVLYLASDQVEVGKVRFQQFCTPVSERGPFFGGQ